MAFSVCSNLFQLSVLGSLATFLWEHGDDVTSRIGFLGGFGGWAKP